jgi:hypothetical protein
MHVNISNDRQTRLPTQSPEVAKFPTVNDNDTRIERFLVDVVVKNEAMNLCCASSGSQ